MPETLFLIDGHALIFKMYYAFLRHPMINSKGADTSILFGFTKYLLELVERERPAALAVAFDPPGGTFRDKLYPAYKANRAETPQLVIDALDPLTEICSAIGFPTLMVPGYEADDVIGTAARAARSGGFDVYMVTPDKDYGQLVDDHIFQYKPGKAGGDDLVLDAPAICARYGIASPSQVIEILTLCGDTADNVPGVKGIGEVGAGKLIARYGTVANIYAHLDELSPRQREQFEAARDHIGLSHELVTIKTDVPVALDTEAMRVRLRYTPAVADLFEKYEFPSLRRHFTDAGPESVPAATHLPTHPVPAEEFCRQARRNGRIGLIVEGKGGLFEAESRMTAATGSPAVIATGKAADFREILEDPSVTKCGQDLKFQIHVLTSGGISLKGRLLDVGLMHYLVDPEKSHRLEILARQYLGVDLDAADAEAEEAPASLFEAAEDPGTLKPRGEEAAAILQLAGRLEEELERLHALRLYESMEEPLIRTLALMEREGVKVDLAQLDSFAGQLREELARRENRIREIAGDPALNISSPKQIGALLFEKLRLDPKAKKSAKGSWTTDEATLTALADKHPVIGEILEFRAAKKLLSTYIEPFPNYVSPVTGKIHTTFNQALTATGRLSSSNPNLQNIPIRTERGKEIRKAFVPSRKDGVIVSADYSQIELRIMAHLSCDTHLCAAFRDGVDVHKATAARIFGIPHEEVTPEQRRIAKTANFGIMYGISSFGLAQRLNVSRSEAARIIEDYFTAFPSIRTYIADTLAAARENGYVETLFGRRRYLPDITSRNATVRALAERTAVNAPIQGTSADIIKLAMIRIDPALREAGLQSRMVLQIHDELLFDAVAEEVDALKRIVVPQMEEVVQLSIPLTVDCNEGSNWLEAH